MVTLVDYNKNLINKTNRRNITYNINYSIFYRLNSLKLFSISKKNDRIVLNDYYEKVLKPMIYTKVIDMIKLDFLSNNLEPSLLPSERDLAIKYSVSRPTIRKALDTLEKEGIIEKQEGRGYLSRQSSKEKYIDHELNSFIGFFQDVLSQGKETESKIIKQTVTTASEIVAEVLNLNTGDLVFNLERIRLVNGNPICIAKSFIPLKLCENIIQYDFTKESLFQVLENHNISLSYAKRSIEVTPSDSFDRLYLNLNSSEPVINFTSIGYTTNDIPFEYEISRYQAYNTKFETTVYK